MKKANLYIVMLAGIFGAIGLTTLATKLKAADSAMPSCCGGMAAAMADQSALMQPVKSVYDHYLIIQAALANDSLKGITENAGMIAKAVQGDDMKMLPAAVAVQAETLAKAADLKAARTAFKPLSNSLIKYLADNKAGVGTYHEAFCPMAGASWLQTEKDIKNPYLGKAMSGCGEFKD